jgi:poly[(R)-3-hydroxyalkanoate] polymerase subunit PhaC
MADQDGGRAFDGGTAYQVKDPEKLASNMLHFFSEGARALTRYMDDKRADGPYAVASELNEAGKLLGVIASHWINEPERLAQRQTQLTEDLVELWGRTYRRFMGEEVEPVRKPAPGDARFHDPEWSKNPFFDFWKQAYLITSNWADDMVRETDGVDEATRRRAQFYLNQITSAISPSNFPATNPEVLRATLSSNGENLLKGMNQLVKDLDESKNLLQIKQTDLSAFAIGKNLAVTPGKVIYQNDVMQLIQYSPVTPDVFSVPLMIVPPWINKYYILDLVPQKSFIKWLVDQGVTVFVVSWVNPDARLSHKSFENYMFEGILEPLSVVQRVVGSATKVNTLGYCVGGTLLGTALAYMAAKGDERINSATFLAAQVDFSNAGDLLVFIDDTQIKALEAMMAEVGYLDGSRMAAVFNMLRPKDLIWPYIVNNYLLGKQPFPFDLLYWNSDTTRMPPANHSFYLREFYQANRLARGDMTIAGVPLDLSQVKLPIYELATREDHIAPAKSVFTGARLFGGPVRFVLAGSGHIAGVINPPEKHKYMFWAPSGEEDAKVMPSLEVWIKKATQHAGSWWPDYAKWLTSLSGEKVPARTPGEGPFNPLEDAPGSYVRG